VKVTLYDAVLIAVRWMVMVPTPTMLCEVAVLSFYAYITTRLRKDNAHDPRIVVGVRI